MAITIRLVRNGAKERVSIRLIHGNSYECKDKSCGVCKENRCYKCEEV